MYEAQADTINVDDISKNSHNRTILRLLQRHETSGYYYKSLCVQNEDEDQSDDECTYYFPEGTNDMGWLGYFIGKNQHLEELMIDSFTPTSGASVRDVIEPFYRGISRNKSIQEIYFPGVDLLGGEVFTILGSFFRNNHNLTAININHCDFGDEGARLFALAIGSSTNKSFQRVELENNNIGEQEMVDIMTALSMHPHLQHPDLDGNRLRKNGSVALATLLRCSAKELQILYHTNNEINDEGD